MLPFNLHLNAKPDTLIREIDVTVVQLTAVAEIEHQGSTLNPIAFNQRAFAKALLLRS